MKENEEQKRYWRMYDDKERVLQESNLCWMCENRVCKVKPTVEEDRWTGIIITRCRYRIDKFIV